VTASIALLHANADLLVGLLIGVAVGLVVGPVLRAWLTYLEWSESSREARLTDELISRFDRDLADLTDDEPASDEERTWRTSR
jgi:hypothetical protein